MAMDQVTMRRETPMPTMEPISEAVSEDSLVNLGFIHAFAASISVVVVSELGDDTFFMAAILAMKHSRMSVFLGAISALAIMTILSALLGYATSVIPSMIIPRWVTVYATSALLAYFGVRMLKEGYYMSPDKGEEEYEEAEEKLAKSQKGIEVTSLEEGQVSVKKSSFFEMLLSRAFLQSFSLTFFAEWGDRSQLATIMLAAREEVVGVMIGGTLGHSICTGLAVLSGRFIAQKVSIRTVTIFGGIVFLIFSVSVFFKDT